MMYADEEIKKIPHSPAGNRTPDSRVTGGDTHHYTTKELMAKEEILNFKSISNCFKLLQYPRRNWLCESRGRLPFVRISRFG